MRGGDARSRRVAIVPHALANGLGDDALYSRARDLLEEHGVGLIELPSLELTETGDIDFWVTITCDQMIDYLKHGYEVFIVGVKDLPGYGIYYPRLVREALRRNNSEPVMVVLDTRDRENSLRLLKSACSR